MLQKNSFVIPSDTSGVLQIKVIQTRRCSTRKHAKVGKFLRVVIRKIKPKYIKFRKRRVRALVIRSSHWTLKPDGVSYKFQDNAVVLLKKRMNTLGKETIGPSCKKLKIKKFKNSLIALF